MQTVLSLLALVASVSAFQNWPVAMKRDLLARQTTVPTQSAGGADGQCIGTLLSLASSAPTLPPAIESFKATASETNSCSFSVPSSLSSAWQSYEIQAYSWYEANSAAFYSAISECPEFSSYVLTGTCKTGSGGSSSATTTSASPGSATSSSSGSGSSSATTGSASSGSTSSGSSTSSQNAGPRETIPVSAGILMAGFLGVVAAF